MCKPIALFFCMLMIFASCSKEEKKDCGAETDIVFSCQPDAGGPFTVYLDDLILRTFYGGEVAIFRSDTGAHVIKITGQNIYRIDTVHIAACESAKISFP